MISSIFSVRCGDWRFDFDEEQQQHGWMDGVRSQRMPSVIVAPIPFFQSCQRRPGSSFISLRSLSLHSSLISIRTFFSKLLNSKFNY